MVLQQLTRFYICLVFVLRFGLVPLLLSVVDILFPRGLNRVYRELLQEMVTCHLLTCAHDTWHRYAVGGGGWGEMGGVSGLVRSDLHETRRQSLAPEASLRHVESSACVRVAGRTGPGSGSGLDRHADPRTEKQPQDPQQRCVQCPGPSGRLAAATLQILYLFLFLLIRQ